MLSLFSRFCVSLSSNELRKKKKVSWNKNFYVLTMKLISLVNFLLVAVIFTLISENDVFAASLNTNHISRESGENNNLLRVKENISNRQCGYKVRLFSCCL